MDIELLINIFEQIKNKNILSFFWSTLKNSSYKEEISLIKLIPPFTNSYSLEEKEDTINKVATILCNQGIVIGIFFEKSKYSLFVVDMNEEKIHDGLKEKLHKLQPMWKKKNYETNRVLFYLHERFRYSFFNQYLTAFCQIKFVNIHFFVIKWIEWSNENDFLQREFYWKKRRNSMLVAFRLLNGKHFHVFKNIACFF